MQRQRGELVPIAPVKSSPIWTDRSRRSATTRPLAEAIRGFDSGFGLGFVVPFSTFRRGLQ